MVTTKPGLRIEKSQAQDCFIVYLDDRTIGKFKKWLLLNARRDLYYWDRTIKVYVLDNELYDSLSRTFALNEGK
jgi:hypothetical protein